MPWAIALLTGSLFAFASSRMAARDSDLFWHLATGRLLFSRGIVGIDQFSWTIANAPVATDQWLGQALWYGAYLVDGWSGIVVLRSLAVFALVALVVHEAIVRRPAHPIVGLLASLPAILIGRFIWIERPELFGFVCFAALLPLLRRAREGSGRAAIVIIPLLIVWANVHGSFALGVGLTLLVAIEGALRDRARLRAYIAIAIGALVACVATPAGLLTLATPGFHLLHPPREIQEWAVPDPASAPGIFWAIALALTLATAITARAPRVTDALVLVPVALLSLTAARHMPLLAIACAPYLADRAPDALALLLRRPPVASPRHARRTPPFVGAIGIAIAAVILGVSAVTAPREPDLGGFPTGALAALPRGAGLLNNYDWGGWLIWYAPDTPVFIDGRLVPYIDSVLPDYRAVLGLHQDWRDVIARRRVRALLVRPRDAVVVRARELGWRVRAEGPEFVLIEVP
ncbi:MAG: hypothetical protein HY071_00935 [Chloroflexi bacterium]|nr:hypothetical protein [Chloroflexota bacterium]